MSLSLLGLTRGETTECGGVEVFGCGRDCEDWVDSTVEV